MAEAAAVLSRESEQSKLCTGKGVGISKQGTSEDAVTRFGSGVYG